MIELDDPLKPFSDICKPDPRQVNLVETLEELHNRLSALFLHRDVPSDIRQMFETAKNARLYTYFVFRFHQAAEMMAYQALERALRHRWNSEVARQPTIDNDEYNWPGLAKLLDDAMTNSWIRNEGFSSRNYRAYVSLEHERAIEAIKIMSANGITEHELQEPTLVEIEERKKQIDTLGILRRHIPTLRNSLAHGSTSLRPISDLVLQDCCDAINMLFER